MAEAISGRSTSKSKQELVSVTLRLHSLLTASVHAHLCARMKRKQMHGGTPTIIKSRKFTHNEVQCHATNYTKVLLIIYLPDVLASFV